MLKPSKKIPAKKTNMKVQRSSIVSYSAEPGGKRALSLLS